METKVIFLKLQKWVANNFNSAQDVIQYESPEEGQQLFVELLRHYVIQQ